MFLFHVRIALRWLFGFWLNLIGYYHKAKRGYGFVCQYCGCTGWVETQPVAYGEPNPDARFAATPLCELCLLNLPQKRVQAEFNKVIDAKKELGTFQKVRAKIVIGLSLEEIYEERKLKPKRATKTRRTLVL